MPISRRDSLWRGAQSEAVFLAKALSLRWEIAKPITDICSYDFLIRRPGFGYERVQVKTVYKDGRNRNRLVVSIRRRSQGKNRKYGEDEVDLIACVRLDTSEVWLIPYPCVSRLASNFSVRGCDPFLVSDSGVNLDDVEALSERLFEVQRQRPNAKVTADVAGRIVAMKNSGLKQCEIATQLRLGRSTVGRVVRGERVITSPRIRHPGSH